MTDRVVEFKRTYPKGRDPVDMVLVAPSGPAFEKTRTWHRVAKIRPPEDQPEKMTGDSYAYMKARWAIVGPAYEAWAKGEEIPQDGTPLGAWGGVTSAQVEALKNMAIYTVEQVAEMGDAACQELRIPNARQLPGLAKKFLETEGSAAKDAKIADMEEKIRIMEEMLNEQQEPKRKPGRPKKTEVA